jgi:hypothetical protein
MSGKFKALGLGLLAAMAISAVAAVNAGATASGHFSSATHHTIFTGTEDEADSTEFSVDGGTGIRCHKTSYTYTGAATLLAGLQLTPTYEKCTTSGEATEFKFTTNDCRYTIKMNSSGGHATVFIECEKGPMEIHHPNCTITVPQQFQLTGVKYTTLIENNKHALTVDVTVNNIAVQYHGGICIFLGTNHTGALTGAFRVRGANTAGEPVDITAT